MRGIYRPGINPIAYADVLPRDAFMATSGVHSTRQLTPTAYDAAGVAIVGGTWTYESSDPSVATVSGTGLVTCVGAGVVGSGDPHALIYATHDSGVTAATRVYAFASPTLTPNEPAGTIRPPWSFTSSNGQVSGERYFDRYATAAVNDDTQGWDKKEFDYLDVGASGASARGGSVVADLNAPVLIGSNGSSKVLKVRYARGFAGGSAPALCQGTFTVAAAGLRRLYVRSFVYVSPWWYANTTGTNKLYNGWCVDQAQQHNNYFLSAEGGGWNDLVCMMRFQGGHANQVARLYPGSGDASAYATSGNATPAGTSPLYSDVLANYPDLYYVRRGRWYMHEEELLIEPAAATFGGTATLRRNGYKTHDYTGVNITRVGEALEWAQLRVDPTYGGAAGHVPGEQEFRYKWILAGLKAA